MKRLRPALADDPALTHMFLDEARLAARVQHPNVVATIDVVATDGELFLIMDYVRGESLSRLLRTAKGQGQKMPPRIAAAIMCGFLHGLQSAHPIGRIAAAEEIAKFFLFLASDDARFITGAVLMIDGGFTAR